MDKEYAIKLLEDYIKMDRAMRDCKVESDFDKFCELHCMAIETLINEVKRSD